MAGKRMLIVPTELIKKIDENRGDMSQAEFIDFLIDSQLKGDATEQNYVTKEEIRSYVTTEEIRSFEQDMKNLFRSFLDFFVGYGLELGKKSPNAEFEELTSKLKGLEKDLESDNDTDTDTEKKKATIKWK